MTRRLGLAVFVCVLTGCASLGTRASSDWKHPATESCTSSSDPVVIHRDDNATLVRWDLDAALWSRSQIPADPAYQQYRHQVEAAGADEMRPAQVVPEHQRHEAFWSRELRNVELAYTDAGTIRPVRCLDALLFAHQNAHVRQLEHPTEFLASILRKTVDGQPRLRVYVGAGDELFPPKSVYGFDQVERDVADGWTYAVMLHNHTIQDAGGQMRLGVPAPSISDVQLLNSLIGRFGLEEAWVTNGLYTVEIRAADMGRYLGPE
ncbi:MAG: hypothetical protein AAF170_11955 [Bacteroidota bacterium]